MSFSKYEIIDNFETWISGAVDAGTSQNVTLAGVSGLSSTGKNVLTVFDDNGKAVDQIYDWSEIDGSTLKSPTHKYGLPLEDGWRVEICFNEKVYDQIYADMHELDHEDVAPQGGEEGQRWHLTQGQHQALPFFPDKVVAPSSGHYTDFSTANDAASAGDRIVVMPGATCINPPTLKQGVYYHFCDPELTLPDNGNMSLTDIDGWVFLSGNLKLIGTGHSHDRSLFSSYVNASQKTLIRARDFNLEVCPTFTSIGTAGEAALVNLMAGEPGSEIGNIAIKDVNFTESDAIASIIRGILIMDQVTHIRLSATITNFKNTWAAAPAGSPVVGMASNADYAILHDLLVYDVQAAGSESTATGVEVWNSAQFNNLAGIIAFCGDATLSDSGFATNKAALGY